MTPARSSHLLHRYCDHHVHTSLCGHATGTMEEYVLAAIDKGLRRISFLEHMEEGISGVKKTWLSESDFDTYFREGIRLQKIFSEKIEVGLGVECGYNPKEKDTLLKRLGKRAWAEIGISCHFLKLPGMNSHVNIFTRDSEAIAIAREYGTEKILTSYFHSLIEAVQNIPGTILCHMDGALRHLPEISLNDGHFKQIDELLQLVSKKKMAVEINTSGLRMRGEQFPQKIILEMAAKYYIDLRIGSDAHKPEDVGYEFDFFREQYC